MNKIHLHLSREEAALVATIMESDAAHPTLILGALLLQLSTVPQSRRFELARNLRQKLMPMVQEIADANVREYRDRVPAIDAHKGEA